MRINKAFEFYQKLGYTPAAVHWIVPDFISNITKPDTARNFYTRDNLVLTASAEQGFLYEVYLNEENKEHHDLLKYNDSSVIEKGKFYIAHTPCFRDEEIIDRTHLHYFNKMELFYYDDEIDESVLKKMIMDAVSFFKYGWSDNNKLLIVEIDPLSYDINGNDVELGSYSIREYILPSGKKIKWCCGTAWAMERTDRVLLK